MKWIIIAGIGNAESKYNNTKHNIGFRILDSLAKSRNEEWKKFKKAGKFIVFKSRPNNIILFKTASFMNNSGKDLIEIMDYFNIPTDSLFLIHDEKGLPLAWIKYSYNVGHNGHKGVANVIHMMQSKEFMRGRFGIGNPFNNQTLEQYVLSPFPKQVKTKITKAVLKMTNDLNNFILHQDFNKLQNECNEKADY